jgi:hypothetical protein
MVLRHSESRSRKRRTSAFREQLLPGLHPGEEWFPNECRLQEKSFRGVSGVCRRKKWISNDCSVGSGSARCGPCRVAESPPRPGRSTPSRSLRGCQGSHPTPRFIPRNPSNPSSPTVPVSPRAAERSAKLPGLPATTSSHVGTGCRSGQLHPVVIYGVPFFQVYLGDDLQSRFNGAVNKY